MLLQELAAVVHTGPVYGPPYGPRTGSAVSAALRAPYAARYGPRTDDIVRTGPVQVYGPRIRGDARIRAVYGARESYSESTQSKLSEHGTPNTDTFGTAGVPQTVATRDATHSLRHYLLYTLSPERPL